VNAWTVIALVIGLVGLVGGAELLVKGAASIATRLGIEPVIVGLTVVAFGTSAPELAVSVGASFGGSSDVAFGNVVGSNIANILLILGASAIVGGLAVSQRIVRIDVPLLLVASVVVLLMALDNSIGRLDGILLFAGVVAYTWWLIRAARRGEDPDVVVEYEDAMAPASPGRSPCSCSTCSPASVCSCSDPSCWSARRRTSPPSSASASSSSD
jgi:cation:H+ antiporter